MITETKTEQLLTQVLEEIRSLRALLVAKDEGEDNLDSYAHSERILSSYRSATEKHPSKS